MNSIRGIVQSMRKPKPRGRLVSSKVSNQHIATALGRNNSSAIPAELIVAPTEQPTKIDELEEELRKTHIQIKDNIFKQSLITLNKQLIENCYKRSNLFLLWTNVSYSLYSNFIEKYMNKPISDDGPDAFNPLYLNKNAHFESENKKITIAIHEIRENIIKKFIEHNKSCNITKLNKLLIEYSHTIENNIYNSIINIKNDKSININNLLLALLLFVNKTDDESFTKLKEKIYTVIVNEGFQGDIIFNVIKNLIENLIKPHVNVRAFKEAMNGIDSAIETIMKVCKNDPHEVDLNDPHEVDLNNNELIGSQNNVRQRIQKRKNANRRTANRRNANRGTANRRTATGSKIG
jgi:hypothetical protein